MESPDLVGLCQLLLDGLHKKAIKKDDTEFAELVRTQKTEIARLRVQLEEANVRYSHATRKLADAVNQSEKFQAECLGMVEDLYCAKSRCEMLEGADPQRRAETTAMNSNDLYKKMVTQDCQMRKNVERFEEMCVELAETKATLVIRTKENGELSEEITLLKLQSMGYKADFEQERKDREQLQAKHVKLLERQNERNCFIQGFDVTN